MSFHIIIPARYESTRFPGKVLADLGGKPVLQHVYQLAELSGADSIVIGTDDDRIKKVAESFGATVCMTSESHQSGSERIAEVINLLEYEEDDVIVGLQADEPLIPATVIRQLANDVVEHDNVKVASVCQLIKNVDELFDPNITKVVLNRRKYAMYFSRSPIPYERENFPADGTKPKKLTGKHYRHIGIYAYRADFLTRYVETESCPAENMELLEQLRILWDGCRIHMTVSKENIPAGIDTETDLKRAQKHV